MLPEEQNFADSAADHPENQKRNCGNTGPTSPEGRAISARNAIRHGMCAKTLILDHENEADWLQLLNTWLDGYQNPVENSLLYTFVLKTAQAEWCRLRAQREYDYFLRHHCNAPITCFEPHELKAHDLVTRYLTAAERRFQRDYRMLEQHRKAHAAQAAPTGRNGNHAAQAAPTGRNGNHAAQAAPTGRNGNHHKVPEPKKPPKQPEAEPRFSGEMPKIRYINNDTGESVDAFGNYYPPPPDYVFRPIIPGVYDPDHPAYEAPASPTGRNGNHEAPASPTGSHGNHEAPPLRKAG